MTVRRMRISNWLGKCKPAHDLDFVAGYDSGHGSKPDAAPFCSRGDTSDPSQIVMVGDSLHDLIAGKRAGMKTIGVLTGLAKKIDLIDHADKISLISPTYQGS